MLPASQEILLKIRHQMESQTQSLMLKLWVQWQAPLDVRILSRALMPLIHTTSPTFHKSTVRIYSSEGAEDNSFSKACLYVILLLLFCFYTGYFSHSLCKYKYHYQHLKNTYQSSIIHKLTSTIQHLYSYNDLLGILLYIAFPLFSVWNSTFSTQYTPVSDCGIITSYFLYFITFGVSILKLLDYVNNNSVTKSTDYI